MAADRAPRKPTRTVNEPVAWMYKEQINCGQGQFYDSDWKLSRCIPPERALCVTPLYKRAPR